MEELRQNWRDRQGDGEAIRGRDRVRVMGVMGRTGRPDSEDCKGQQEESGTEEAMWSKKE